MLEIVCENCGKKYRIDEKKLKRKISKLSCSSCKHIIVVEKPDTPAADDLMEKNTGVSGLQTADFEMKVNGDIDRETVEYDTEADFGFGEDPEKEGRVGSFHSPATEGSSEEHKIAWINKIQVRVGITLVVLTTLILFIFAFLYYLWADRKMNGELKMVAGITTNRLSKNLIEPFWALDDTLIEEAILSEMMDKQIFGILIRDRDGKTVYIGMKRNKNMKIIKTRRIFEKNLTMSRKEIVRKGEKIGTLEVYLTPVFMQRELRKTMVSILATAIILNLIIFVSIFYMLRKMIIRPILDLTEAANRMSLGNYDVPFNINSKNEIGMLMKAFERMQTSLRMIMERVEK